MGTSSRWPVRRKRRRRLLGVAVALTALTVSAQLLSPAEANAADQYLKMIQFNACGSACYLGSITAAGDITNSIRSHGARIVTLNEMCLNQEDQIEIDAGLYGIFTETNGPNSGLPVWNNNCAGGHYGNAILSDNLWSQVATTWPLADPSTTEQRKLTCRETRYLHTIDLCVTHIAPTPTASRSHQINDVRYQADQQVLSHWATLLGGDFNSTPYSSYLNQIYNDAFPAGYGLFAEIAKHCGSGGSIDRCGAPTHSTGKIDYVFVDGEGGWRSPAAAVGQASVSDHDVLKGSIYLQE